MSNGKFQQCKICSYFCTSLLLFSYPVMSDSLRPRGLPACQVSLSLTISRCLPKLMSIASVMPSSHLILWCPLLLPSVFPSIRDFSSESVGRIRCPEYCSFSISPSNEYSGLISLKIDWFDLLAVQGLSVLFLKIKQNWNVCRGKWLGHWRKETQENEEALERSLQGIGGEINISLVPTVTSRTSKGKFDEYQLELPEAGKPIISGFWMSLESSEECKIVTHDL